MGHPPFGKFVSGSLSAIGLKYNDFSALAKVEITKMSNYSYVGGLKMIWKDKKPGWCEDRQNWTIQR